MSGPSKTPRAISVVVDNDSWILPHARRLVELVRARGDDAHLVRSYDAVPRGDVAFLLGCVGIAPAEVLARNGHTLVVHESDLPKGRGFAPLTWAILGGASEVVACLIEATDGPVDSGRIFARRVMRFHGHELNDELRDVQGRTTIALCLDFLSAPEPPEGMAQEGTPDVLPRRHPEDSRLDPARSIAEQFDLLRVVDNARYPAFFDFRGHRYVLRIERDTRADAPDTAAPDTDEDFA